MIEWMSDHILETIFIVWFISLICGNLVGKYLKYNRHKYEDMYEKAGCYKTTGEVNTGENFEEVNIICQ